MKLTAEFISVMLLPIMAVSYCLTIVVILTIDAIRQKPKPDVTKMPHHGRWPWEEER